MTQDKIKVGINGFGRIGRVIYRINEERQLLDIVAINDTNPDNGSLAYQLKYDTTYSTFNGAVDAENDALIINGKKVKMHHTPNIDEVAWSENINLIIDSSGIAENVRRASKVVDKGLLYLVTHAPPKEVIERQIIMGVNEEILTPEDKIVASSICDSTAFAPVMKVLHENFGIEYGSLTTLHPWLSYQNLLDGPSRSFAEPDQIYRHYNLGRGSIGALIPKTTSCIPASEKVLDFLEGKFMSHSFRVPTSIVSCADITVKLSKKTTTEEVIELFKKEEEEQKLDIFHNNFEPLISTDFTRSPFSANLDHEFTEVNSSNHLKMVFFYDNEWGYSSRVMDLIEYMGKLGE